MQEEEIVTSEEVVVTDVDTTVEEVVAEVVPETVEDNNVATEAEVVENVEEVA